MSYSLKELYSRKFYTSFAATASFVVPGFNKNKFLKLIFDEQWENRELMERMKHTSFVLNSFLSKNFEHAALEIKEIITLLKQKEKKEISLVYLFFPDYIEKYGIYHFNTSVKLLAYVTQFITCEFAVRPFIIIYGDKMMEQMYKWSKHKNHHVRRLASEGSRPRLPWAIALPEFKKDPSPVLPILEILKNDPSEYVRRSVANNLNDISKDNPEIVMKLAVKWRGVTKETDAIVKHACRTLLKKADPKILKLFGVSDNKFIEINNVLIHTPGVKIGDYLIFSFSLINKGIKPVNARIEYAIYYLLRNGNYSKKVFKISERRLDPNQTSLIKSKRSFKPVTTRTFYPGKHRLAVIINGREREVMDFNLCN